MQGARWGWLAFIAAIGILFAASSHDQSSNNKVASLLRQELKSVVAERDSSQAEQRQTSEALGASESYSSTLEQELQQTSQELKAMKAEREKLRKELSSLTQDRHQLQQTVASLQVERSQTRRSIDQLRQGLNQLLTQTEGVAQVLASPAPGFAQISFDETPSKTPARLAKPVVPQSSPLDGTYFADEPLNENQ